MPVSITSVRGLGGSPATAVQVIGTATSCERVRVTASCADAEEAEVVNGQFGATLKSAAGCACGGTITVTVTCIIGANAGDTWTGALSCGDCPAITVTPGQPGPCLNGTRAVTVTVALGAPLATPGAFLLDFGDGTTGAGFTLQSGSVTLPPHPYAAGAAAVGRTITLTVLLPQGCPPIVATVQIPACAPCCPTVTLQPPVVVDCAAAAASTASFVATVTVPPGCAAPAAFAWTLTEQSSGRQWFRTGGTSLDTTTGWTTGGGGPAGPVDLSGGGNFAVAVVPVGLDPACTMSLATHTFTVRRRCPAITGPVAVIPQGDGCNFAFSVPVDNPCNLPLTFEWTFHDTSTPVTTTVPQVSHRYADGTTISGALQVKVKAAGCADQAATAHVSPACTPGTPPPETPPPTTTPVTPPPMSIGCWVLLVLALVLAVVATVLGIIAACASNPYVAIAAVIVAVVALILLVLWLILCARTGCPVLITLIDIVTFIVTVLGPLVGVLVAIFGTPFCGLLAGLITSGYWGTILGILVFGARLVGCLRAP